MLTIGCSLWVYLLRRTRRRCRVRCTHLWRSAGNRCSAAPHAQSALQRPTTTIIIVVAVALRLGFPAVTHGLADSRHRSRRPPASAQGHSIALVPACTPHVASAASASEIHAPLPLTRALTLYRRRAAAAARGDAGPRPLHLATLVTGTDLTVISPR